MVALIRRPPITDEMSQLMGSKVKRNLIEIFFHSIPTEKYDQLAKENRFIVTFKEVGYNCQIYHDTEKVLAAWTAITHGKFNTETADQEALTKFKEKYSGQPIEWKNSTARYILTKT